MTDAQRAIIRDFRERIAWRRWWLAFSIAWDNVCGIYAVDCERQRRVNEKQKRLRYER